MICFNILINIWLRDDEREREREKRTIKIIVASRCNNRGVYECLHNKARKYYWRHRRKYYTRFTTLRPPFSLLFLSFPFLRPFIDRLHSRSTLNSTSNRKHLANLRRTSSNENNSNDARILFVFTARARSRMCQKFLRNCRGAFATRYSTMLLPQTFSFEKFEHPVTCYRRIRFNATRNYTRKNDSNCLLVKLNSLIEFKIRSMTRRWSSKRFIKTYAC